MKHKELLTNSIIAIVLVSLAVLTMCFTPLAITASATPKPIYKGNGSAEKAPEGGANKFIL